MAKHSKRYLKLLKAIDTKKIYSLDQAFALLKEHASVKFVPSVDVAVKLNLDTTKPEQQLRGTFILPHAVVKQVKILVIDDAFTKEDAQATGADHYGGSDKIDEIKQG